MSESSRPVDTASASIVAHLYGIRFSSPPTPQAMMTTCYSTGRPMETHAVATVMVMIALWDLRRRGAIALEPYREKKLFGTKSGVRIRLLAEVGASGIDAALQTVLTKKKKAREPGIDAKELVNSAVPRSYKPFSEVIGMAILREAAEGYVSLGQIDGPVDKHGKPGKPKPHYFPVEDRIAALAPAAESLLASWNDFAATEPELKEMLWNAVSDGISLSTRTVSEDSDD